MGIPNFLPFAVAASLVSGSENLLYSPTRGQPQVLPQLLTEGIVADAIQTL